MNSIGLTTQLPRTAVLEDHVRRTGKQDGWLLKKVGVHIGFMPSVAAAYRQFRLLVWGLFKSSQAASEWDCPR